MDNKEKILGYCNDLGIDLVGFTKCRKLEELKDFFLKRKNSGLENEFEEKDIDKRINPFIYMEDGRTIISIAFPYMHEKYNSSSIYFSKYTLGMDYHKVVSSYLERICDFISSLGGKAKYFVDSNALPERYIAYLCGIGFRGKNNLIITKKYGSYVFLGEIITDLEMESDIPKESECGECDLCLKSCPTKAINKAKSNPNICLSYITQKKELEDYWLSKFGGRLFGCDTCQNICPYNMEIGYSEIKEFKPFDFMKNIDHEELLDMSKKEFNEKYKLTSCGWRGKNVIQRNVLINLFNLDKIQNRENKSFKSPYLQDYYNRLLKISKI